MACDPESGMLLPCVREWDCVGFRIVQSPRLRAYATTDAMNSMQFEVLIEMGALHLEGTGQLRSKYTVLLLLEAVKCVHSCCTC